MFRWLPVLFAVFWSSVAFAICEQPPPVLLGTIPADGATNVALNTRFVVFTQKPSESATLNEVALTREQANIWKAEDLLTPDTEYTVVFELDNGTNTSVTFTTGSEVAEMPSAPVVHGYDAFVPDDVEDADCRRLVMSTGCADQDYPTLRRFDVESESDLFIANTKGHPEFHQLWPKECGTPVWAGYGEECFDVSVIENGQVSPPTRTCTDLAESTSGTESSCSQTGSVLPWGLAFLFMFLGVFRLRR